MNNKPYTEPSQDSGKRFFQAMRGKGNILMLNLLKFKPRAEYEASHSQKASSPITGKEAYQRYLDGIRPALEDIGSRIIFQGACFPFLIGPESERWDLALLVQHESADTFIAFSQSNAYLENVKHRIAAVEDSRLLPIIERTQ